MTEEEMNLPTVQAANCEDSVAVNAVNLFNAVSLFTTIAEDETQDEKTRKRALTACNAADLILADHRKKKRQQLKLDLNPEKAAKGPKKAAG